jgi:trans-aconitate methyltransferase
MRISVPQSSTPGSAPAASQPAVPGFAPLPAGPIDQIGVPIWDSREIAAELKGFLPFYETRPIRQNDGGMKSSGLFTLWHILKKVNPKLVVESGVWKGQSTWLIENALPEAAIFAIDPASEGILYRTKRAEYTTNDFTILDWSNIKDYLADTLVFFDDHQDVFARLKLCRELGIKTVILDDNYPEYSGNRHISLAAILNQKSETGAMRFPKEREYLLDAIASYHKFPPVFDYREAVTMETSYITTPSIFGAYDPARHAGLEPYWQDASSYRWTSLVRFK